MKILAIESSCDDTSAAVIEKSLVRSNIISSQHFHKKFGGIVPELASRAHIQLIHKVVDKALDESNCKIEKIDAIAVTSEPGLIGSLIVGANFAKGLALRYDLPIVPVNHIEGHIFSGCLQENSLDFPFVSLVVSGGHTTLFYVESYMKYSVMGSTRDDAAGEAFDKIATLLGLGYPGGPVIDRLAKEGNAKAYDFPRSMMHYGNYDFSFSGLKTSVRYFLKKEFPDGVNEELLPDICASVQAAITDVLVRKTVSAAREKNVKGIVIAGGVSANSELRSKMQASASKIKINVVAPELNYCMDNAAMIGFLAEKKIESEGMDRFRSLDFAVGSQPIRAARRKKKKS